MDRSDLSLFKAKKAIPGIWYSNWNRKFARFSFADWFYGVQFPESSWAKIREFLNSGTKNIRSSFSINLKHSVNVSIFMIFNLNTFRIWSTGITILYV